MVARKCLAACQQLGRAHTLNGIRKRLALLQHWWPPAVRDLPNWARVACTAVLRWKSTRKAFPLAGEAGDRQQPKACPAR